MKILRLTLTNFKGVKDFALNAQGENITAKGDNGAGKTTLFDAFTWLLFDKDSQNKAKFDIKTLDKNNNALHGLDHEVEAVLEIDGKQITLKKSFREKWQKKRGSAEQQFTGHTTDFYIDDVPVKQKDYLARIAKIADESIFKLLTNPRYFNEQLKWEQRREILLEICGDIGDEEVIASDDKLAKLPEILGDRSLDEYKSIIKSQQKKINDELEKLPIRIDEVVKGLPDIEGVDVERISEKVNLLKESIRKKEQELNRIDAGGEVAEKTKRLREVEAELQGIKNRHTAKLQGQISDKQRELNTLLSNVDTQSTIGNKKRDLEYNNLRIESLEDEIVELREEFVAENKKEFTFEQDDTCPTCGQKLPQEQLEEARQKALEAFNLAKANKLQSINAKGKKLKAEQERLNAENTATEAEIKKLTAQLAQEEKKVKALRNELAELEQQSQNLPPAYDEKLKKKEELETAIAVLKGGSKDEKAKIYEQIAALEESVRDAERVLSSIDTYEKGQKRIEELRGQEKKLAAEYAELEKRLFLTEEFTRTKVRLLEEKVNGKFRLARFKMFDVQVNGGIFETCETIYNGVPYSTGLNAGHQIIVGLDIIRTLSEHYQFFPPIFVDNAESVTELPEMEAQVIRLVKPEINSEEDRVKYSRLVVETEKELVKEAV
jgi:DNA repair exonuclease SbcCD ATPase subunit